MNRRTLIAGAGALGVSALLPRGAQGSEILPEDYYPVPGGENTLQIHKVTTRFLGAAALKQFGDVQKTTSREMDLRVDLQTYQRRVVPCQFLTAPILVSKEGYLEPEPVRRWSAMLNSLADRGIWNAGTLSPTFAMRLVDTGYVDSFTAMLRGVPPTLDRYKQGLASLFTFIFCTSVKDHEEMNQIIGAEVSHVEGEMTTKRSDFWERFPWA